MTLRVFMRYINKALKTKTGKAQPMVARKVYGQVKAYAVDYPDEVGELAEYFDYAPRGWNAERYISYMRARIQELRGEKRKIEEGRRCASRENRPQTVQEILSHSGVGSAISGSTP